MELMLHYEPHKQLSTVFKIYFPTSSKFFLLQFGIFPLSGVYFEFAWKESHLRNFTMSGTVTWKMWEDDCENDLTRQVWFDCFIVPDTKWFEIQMSFNNLIHVSNHSPNFPNTPEFV